MMNENDIVDLLKKTEQIGVKIWLDGGWGVDALVGCQTRQHNDVDIFIQKKDAIIFIEMLSSNGYSEIWMEYTSEDHTTWQDAGDRIVDLHLFEFAEAGMMRYENELYPSDILKGKGTIGGIAVRCLTAEAQLLYHQGYKHDENDVHDVFLLCEKFELPIPEKYLNG